MSKRLGYLVHLLQKIWARRALFWRVLLCWLVGIAVLFSERNDNFDLRFRARGSVLSESPVVLILMSNDEWHSLQKRDSSLRPLKEIDSLSEALYSDRFVWENILQSILKRNPVAVGVSVYVGLPPEQGQHPSSPLLNQKVFWAARLDNEGQTLRPRVLGVSDRQIGIVDFRDDPDGYWRRTSTLKKSLPNLAIRLSQTYRPGILIPKSESLLVNFQGPTQTFLTFSLTEVLYGNLPKDAFNGKIVVIGARGSDVHMVRTPVGPMSKAEAIANITHNVLYMQWIRSLPLTVYALGLLVILLLCVLIVTTYSQTVGFVVLGSLWALLVGVSTWIFDQGYLWLPLLSLTAMVVITFVIFLSYQLLLNEQANWQLQREKRYLKDVEEIKNNFLSLISHDLKTPIAKIHAVAEKLMASPEQQSIQDDMRTVKAASQELYRYIQSLLQVTRVESTDFQARKKPTDINELIQKAVDSLLPLAQGKQVSLTFQVEPIFSFEIDPVLIQEVIINLIENAIKYTPSGGKVTVESREIENWVEVRVTDTGVGIPQAEIPKVWNRFFRGSHHNLVTKGTGLGLYLSRYFIRMHEGEVFLQSEVGKGTEVGFRLPLLDSNDANEG